MEPATTLPEVDPMPRVEEQALALPDEARALRIANDVEAQAAGAFLRERCKAVLAEVDRTFDPIIRAAHAAHKEAVAQKARVSAPILEAERIVKGAIAEWSAEQERIRREEQAARDRAARELAEREALERAQRLQDQGLMAAAEAVIAAPVRPVPIVAAAPPPKIEGVSVRKTFNAEVLDFAALVRAAAADERYLNLLMVNTAALRQLAAALKEGFNVPGCRLVVRGSVAARV